MTADIFRPVNEPAGLIYDIIVEEAKLRDDKEVDDWILAERTKVWEITKEYSEAHGLIILTMTDIEHCEIRAGGHIDYAAKWAYCICDLLNRRMGKLRL